MSAAPSLDVTVAALEQPAPGVRTLRLVPAQRGPLRPYAPGSHVEVDCGDHRNAYSLISDPRDTSHYAISVRRLEQGRGGSRWLHDAVRRGDVLRIGTPRSQFAPPASARFHLLIGAGIGVTPFLSYARAFARTRVPYVLHAVHPAGSPAHAALRELPAAAVRTHSGRAALRRALPALLERAPAGTHMSVCGPPAMIDELLATARDHGWPEHRLHSERFTGVQAPAGEPFRVRLARSGGTLDVAAGTPLLDALEAAGVAVPSLCRQGVCGECRVGVLAGRPDHHDLHLSPAERARGDVMMACVSRCAGDDLELDL